MGKPETLVLSIFKVLSGVLLLSTLIRWPLLVGGVVVVGCGAAVLWHRSELRRLNRWIDDRCEGCGYDLRHIGRSGRCPECGKPFTDVGPVGEELPAQATPQACRR